MSILALYHRIGHGQEGLPWVLRTKVVCTVAVAITLFTVAIFLVSLPDTSLAAGLTPSRSTFSAAHPYREPGTYNE